MLASLASDSESSIVGGNVINYTLLGGFKSILSNGEKRRVTELLTLGEMSSLAEAARIMHRAINKPKKVKAMRSKSFIQCCNLRSFVFF